MPELELKAWLLATNVTIAAAAALQLIPGAAEPGRAVIAAQCSRHARHLRQPIHSVLEPSRGPNLGRGEPGDAPRADLVEDDGHAGRQRLCSASAQRAHDITQRCHPGWLRPCNVWAVSHPLSPYSPLRVSCLPQTARERSKLQDFSLHRPKTCC